jgi:hypothetical protein
MAEVEQKFKIGDFLKKDNKKGSFMIYEGKNISDSSYKKMTLLCVYDPEKYMPHDGLYDKQPYLEVGTKTKPCSETINTEEEDFWVKKCTEKEKQEALELLKEYGYVWLEETLELIDMETGELVRKIVVPDNKYHGELIHSNGNKFNKIIKSWCESKIPPRTYYPYDRYDYYDD